MSQEGATSNCKSQHAYMSREIFFSIDPFGVSCPIIDDYRSFELNNVKNYEIKLEISVPCGIETSRIYWLSALPSQRTVKLLSTDSH